MFRRPRGTGKLNKGPGMVSLFFAKTNQDWRRVMLSPVWRLHLSWLVLAAGGLWGISFARAHGPTSGTLTTALQFAYITWSLYWGVPPFWRWWRKTFSLLLGPLGCMAFGCGPQFVIAFAVLFLMGPPFCLLGGGLYQFALCCRAARYHL